MSIHTHNRAVSAFRAKIRTERRGTFIVLVVGMLALMTIIAVVYFSIGQADSRSAAAAKAASDRDRVPQLIGSYIAQVIADDVTATLFDAASGDFIREAWDYPGTSPAALNSESGAPRFTARGVLGDDPFLSSTEPTILNLLAPGLPADPAELYIYRRDWLAISNIAPDGNYVNLHNLRDNFTASTEDMRENLRLFNATGTLVAPAQTNVPALLSNNQFHLFRPAVAAPGSAVNDVNYLPYHFADADGDGFFDSRWQELVDRIDPANPLDILPSDSRYRYFVAARIVDLNARADINTATTMYDTASAPTDLYPYGVTPADVDIRSLLNMQDSYLLYGDGTGRMGTGAADYNIVNPAAPGEVSNYGAMTDEIARDVGDEGYNAARLSLKASLVPEPRADLTEFATKYLGGGETGDQRSPTAISREQWYLTAGGPSGTAAGNDSVRLTGGFGLTSLQDLLTFRVANDPAQLSLLESALGGRFPSAGGADPQQTRRYSVLRDNRGLLLERPTIDEPLPGNAVYRGAMLTFASDVRQRLTTLSGSRPIRPWNGVPSANASLDQPTGATAATDFSLDARSIMAQRDVNALFRAYADALLPYSDRAGVWNRGGSDFNQTRTLAYGYDGPELPIRIAAHMAANLQSMAFPSDPLPSSLDTPQAYTVILNESVRGALESSLGSGDIASRTFKHVFRDANVPLLDLGAGRIATTGDGVGTAVLTVYGVTPQPVLTGIASFSFYCDVPTNRGGDDEYEPPPFPGEPFEVNPITINGSTDFAANTDYLGRVLAFQITNPSDVAIELDTSDLPGLQYYLDFGGNQFRLAEFTPESPADPPLAVTLPARSSRVFYVLDRTYTEINNRWISTATAFGALSEPIDANIFKLWLNQHLTVSDNPNGVGALSPVLIRAVDPVTGILLPSAPDLFSATTELNDVANLWRMVSHDLSDDNFVPGSSGTQNSTENDYLVDRLRVPAGESLDRTLPTGQQDIGSTVAGNESSSAKFDNTGYTVTPFASVRRPAGASAGATGLPVYMLERKSAEGSSLNRADDDEMSLGSLVRSNFGGSNDSGYREFADFLEDQTNSGKRVAPFLAHNPSDWITALSLPSVGSNGSGQSYSDVVPEFTRAGIRQKYQADSLRPGDLLLPLGFGAWVEMDNAGNSVIENNWTTLGEALALATDYARNTGGFSPSMDSLGSSTRLGGTGFPALFRGNLIYRDFISYLDTSGDLILDVDANGIPTETVYGLGLPPALRILDTFHTLQPDYRSPTVATRGLININTASVEVLRALRLLSPSVLPADRAWWTAAGTGVGAYDATSDVASTLVAYRDRLAVLPRTNPMPMAIAAANLLDFSDENSVAYGGGNITGRTFATAITGINESRGFRSIGEVLLASDLRSTNFDVHAIDRFGLDGTDLSQAGIDMRDGSDPDGLDDEYSESIAIASGISSMITVRSDTFAVWFVLHGYEKGDVEPLNNNDPLVPSIARRFLMVIDRSNVTAAGQQPQILLFQEVPYAEIPY